MEHHVSGLTQVVNHYFGRFALALLGSLHIQPHDPENPIPEQVVMSLLVLLLVTLLALWVRSRLSVEKPGASQQVAELLLTNPLSFGIRDQVEENIHHWKPQHIYMVGAVALFILFSNLMSVFPFLTAPTSVVTVPLAAAAITFLYFNWQGLRHHGVGRYLLTFAGSPRTLGDGILAVLLFPVEIISTMARLLSLTVRLWANIFASDLLYGIFLSLLVTPAVWGWSKHPLLGVFLGIFPALIPIAFIGLHIFVAVI
ncbi:MAG TPA: FoF1 ATP synthase subunit a, partial [Candidatus Eremiobacteraceae bacterium]|nr:FoF1 ATP synthase subunit a [Candidatus Eremiobacteraceae bacterium]